MSTPSAAPRVDPAPAADAVARTQARAAGHDVLLFDGVCNFCHWAVRFIIARDPGARFRFASIQSDYGRAVVRREGLPDDVSTMVLVEDSGRVSTRSTAALRVATRLGGLWPLFGVLLVLPRVLRDAPYELLARNRYRWFGRKESCPLPDPSEAERFLD